MVWFAGSPDTLMQNLHLADFTCGGGGLPCLLVSWSPTGGESLHCLLAGALLLLLPLSAARTALTLVLLLGAYTGTAPLLSLWCNGPLLVRCSYAPHSGGWCTRPSDALIFGDPIFASTSPSSMAHQKKSDALIFGAKI